MCLTWQVEGGAYMLIIGVETQWHRWMLTPLNISMGSWSSWKIKSPESLIYVRAAIIHMSYEEEAALQVGRSDSRTNWRFPTGSQNYCEGREGGGFRSTPNIYRVNKTLAQRKDEDSSYLARRMRIRSVSSLWPFFFGRPEHLRYVMKLYTTIGIVALGIVAIGSWWIVKESLNDIRRISKDPMPETATPEQLAALQEKFKTRR